MSPLKINSILAVLLLAGLIFASRRYRPNMPLLIALLHSLAAVYLAVFKRFVFINADSIPSSGPLILVANHTTSYDPVCMQVACKNRLIRFMQAREFYDQRPMYFLYRSLRVIPVNRTGNDTASIRTALRELSNNGCIGLFPEGKISEDGALHEARMGVAMLALVSNARVVPAFIQGTRPFSGMLKDFTQFNRVILHFGTPIRFDDLAGRHRDEAARKIALERIMDAIVTLRTQSETLEDSCAAS